MDYNNKRELEPSNTLGYLRQEKQENETFDLDDSFDNQGVSETIERWKDERLKKLAKFTHELDNMKSVGELYVYTKE